MPVYYTMVILEGLYKEFYEVLSNIAIIGQDIIYNARHKGHHHDII